MLSRLRNISLWRSWATWREFTEESLAHKDKMAVVVNLWTNRSLGKAFHTWKAYWERRTRGTIALVHYYGGIMDKVTDAFTQM